MKLLLPLLLVLRHETRNLMVSLQQKRERLLQRHWSDVVQICLSSCRRVFDPAVRPFMHISVPMKSDKACMLQLGLVLVLDRPVLERGPSDVFYFFFWIGRISLPVHFPG